MSEQTEDEALAVVGDYAAEQESAGVGDDLKRYAASSAKFAAIGGAVGSVFPGVGTALGGMVGAGAGVAVEAVGDIIDFLGGDEKKRTKEAPDKAERAVYTYQALGGEEGTKLPYPQWWKLYVAAGRPPLEVLQATLRAERAAARALRKAGAPAPPPPPPPKRSAAFPFATASTSTAREGLDGIEDEQRAGNLAGEQRRRAIALGAGGLALAGLFFLRR